jgi:hypothetical protein
MHNRAMPKTEKIFLTSLPRFFLGRLTVTGILKKCPAFTGNLN